MSITLINLYSLVENTVTGIKQVNYMAHHVTDNLEQALEIMLLIILHLILDTHIQE